jgi:hypothetical protein
MAGNRSLVGSLLLHALAVLTLPALVWNIPGHMLSAAITYHVLRQESPQSIEKLSEQSHFPICLSSCEIGSALSYTRDTGNRCGTSLVNCNGPGMFLR